MKILVTGGGGFLGQALCRGLVERGHQVASFNRGHYPALDAQGVEQLRGDLADREAVLAAFAGFHAVFHNAAKAGAWVPTTAITRRTSSARATCSMPAARTASAGSCTPRRRA